MRIQYFYNYPIISVIITTFNRCKYIPRALRSLEVQTFKNFEVIVCDDGSTDGTDELVEMYTNKTSLLLRYVKFSHRGVAKARNIGLQLAYGRYIALLDSDDTYHTDKLSAQVEVMERNSEAVFCYTGYQLMPTGTIIDPGIFQRNKFLSENYLCCASVMMRHSTVTKVGGYDPSLGMSEDWDLLIRLSNLGSVLHIHEPMYEYYLHTEQITNQIKHLKYFTSIVRSRHGGKEPKSVSYLNTIERERLKGLDLKK